MSTAGVLEQVARIAPEVAGGYGDVRRLIATDAALGAGEKALLVAAAATARGYDELAAAELARGRELGLAGGPIGAVGTALLLARGEVVCGRFARAAGELAADGPPRPPSELGPAAYFLDFFGVEALPTRMAVMAEHAPAVFAGYHRMHHGVLRADPDAVRIGELAMVAVNAAELQTRFVAIHAASARAAGVTDAELVEAVVCAIPVSGVAAWAAAAEGLFP